MPNPFQFPPALQAKFATNRRKYGDLQMMSDEAPEAPEAPQEPAQQPENGQQGEDDKGAGSKDALKADLAEERNKRQALEKTVSEMRDGFAKALGIKADEVTPEQLAEQLTQAQADGAAKDARITVLEQVVDVFTSAPANVDVQALIDSKQFTDKLAADKPADLKAFVTDYAKDHPRFLRQTGTGGDLGAGHGAIPENVTPGVGRLAAAFEQQLNKN